MSIIGQEIREHMSAFVMSDNETVSACFTFPASFTGFNGHFPDNPVVPGVCQLQCVVAIYEALLNATVTIEAIESVKFIAPISCNEELVFTCKGVTAKNESFLVTATGCKDLTKVSTLKLRLKVDNN